jgi:hypothetical protein
MAQLDSMAFEGVWGDPFAGHPQPVIFEAQHFELARPQMLAAAFFETEPRSSSISPAFWRCECFATF